MGDGEKWRGRRQWYWNDEAGGEDNHPLLLRYGQSVIEQRKVVLKGMQGLPRSDNMGIAFGAK